MLVYVQFLVMETPPSTNTQSSPVSIILGVVFGICALLLFIFGIFVVWLCLRKLKRKESSEAAKEHQGPVTTLYVNPDAPPATATGVQLSVRENIYTTTADNKSPSTKEILQDKEVTEDFI